MPKLKTAFLSELGFIGLRDFKMVSCLEIVLHTEAGRLKPGNWELEAGRSKTEVGSWELGAGSWETEDRNEVEANLHSPASTTD